MTSIPDKLRTATDEAVWRDLNDAVRAVIAKAEAWQTAGMPMSALGDELLLTIGPPLGVRLEVGQFAQLVDLDEAPSRTEGSAT